MRIAVLGPLAVDGTSTLAPRDRVVLAALTLRRGEVVGSETLADALWPNEPPPTSWAKVIQGCVVRLRKLLGPVAIETAAGGYRLTIAPDEIDGDRFERLVGHAREMLALGEPDRAVFAVDEALRLWRGPALGDLEEWEHGRIEAARLDELRLEAEELRIDAALNAGRFREVIADAQAHVSRAPFREHRWMLLARAQHQAGNQRDALRTLHRAREVLVRELGIDPGRELVELEDAILRQDPSLLTERTPDPSPACPYQGLTAYDVADSDSFFGRDPEIAECLRRLRANGVLAVVGPSGSGKSSLVRAGVAAAVHRSGDRVIVITPGPRPMRSFEAAGRSQHAVLIVDQCEEAITLCSDPDERAAFFTALACHADSAPLVIGLRADRLGESSAYPAFAGLVERGLYVLRGMDPDHLRAAIEGPARQAGLLLEPGLVDLLVREVEGEPGSLPLLSHALRQTWERREGNTLTVAGYQQSGGIRGAVAQSAELVYDQQSAEGRQMVRDLMMRLVSPGIDGDAVRSRVPRRIAAPDAERELLVDSLAKARLVTSDAESVELAHEALARAWPRLQEWLDDDVEGQRMWRHLASTADTWDAMGRPDSELYRGVRLARLGEWLQRTHPDLNGIERDFVEAAERLADYEQTEAERRARRQVRVNRRLRGLTAGVAVLAAVAVVTGALGIRQARRADHEAELARSHELAASAIGIVDDDPTVAKLLAVAAADVGPSTLAADAALHETIAADHTVARWGFTGEVGVLKGALNPAGDRLAAAGVFQSDGTGWTVHIVNPYTDEEAWQVDLSTSGAASTFVTNPFFTADGRYVVAGSYWDPYGWRRMPIPFEGVDEPIVDLLGANVWDAASGARVERIDLGRCGGAVTALTDEYVLARTLHGSPDVLRDCRWRDGSVGVELIDRRSGERQVLTTGSGGFWDWGAAMSGDGSEVAYDDGATGEIVVIDVATGVELLRASGSGVRDLSPDGSFVLVGDQPIEVWDVATGQPMSEFDGHHGPSTFARFGPIGDTVYSTGDDGVLREWEAANGRERASYPAVGSGPVSVNSSGLVAVSNPDQQYVTIIDTERRGELGAIDTCEGPPVSDTLEVVARSAVVHEMCSGARSSTAYVVDLDAGRPSASVADRESGALAVSPNGDRFVDQDVTGTADGEAASAALTVRDVGTGDQLLALDALPGHDAWPFAARVQWSSDGRMIAAAMGTEVAVWDAETGTLLNTASSARDDIAVNDVLFTPDSEAVVATTSDRRIVRRSLDDWDSAVERDISIIDGTYSTGLVGFAGSSVVVIGGFQGNASSTLSWLDSKTFEVQHSLSNIHEGSVLAADLDRTAGLIATAASDGSAKVWDATTGELLHEITGDGSPIRGIAFDGDRRLLVAPNSGGLEVITIDSVELLDLARQSLTKGFSAADCDHFNFADACPTLSELRNQRATDDTIVGSYRATLRVDDLVDTIQYYSLSVYGEQLIPGDAEEFASSFAGAYTVTFESGRFDITKDSAADPVCSGSYSVLGDHVWMRSERGVQCYPIKLLDGTFELTDDALVIESADLHAEDPWWLVFASRPLERI